MIITKYSISTRLWFSYKLCSWIFQLLGIYVTLLSFYTWLFSFLMSGIVYTGVKVCRIDSEMSRLVERPWLQLMYCAVYLLRGRNFRWWGEVQDGSECWLVCCYWTLEIKFNKSLSSSIIRLVNYNVITSLIYKLIV